MSDERVKIGFGDAGNICRRVQRRFHWWCGRVSLGSLQFRNDFIRVVDTTTPDAAASLHQRRPQARVCGELGMGREVRPGFALGEHQRALVRAEDSVGVADQMDGAGERFAIDDDLDLVALKHFANGPGGERFRRDVSDAGARGDAAEARVGEQGNVLAVRQLLERGGDLINLLHAGAGRTPADQYKHVAARHIAALDGLDGRLFRDEDFGRAEMTIDLVLVNKRGIDGCALDDRALGREVAHREADGGRESFLRGARRAT